MPLDLFKFPKGEVAVVFGLPPREPIPPRPKPVAEAGGEAVITLPIFPNPAPETVDEVALLGRKPPNNED